MEANVDNKEELKRLVNKLHRVHLEPGETKKIIMTDETQNGEKQVDGSGESDTSNEDADES